MNGNLQVQSQCWKVELCTKASFELLDNIMSHKISHHLKSKTEVSMVPKMVTWWSKEGQATVLTNRNHYLMIYSFHSWRCLSPCVKEMVALQGLGLL